MLAAGAAPAVVRASSLMKLSGIVIPTTLEVMDINFTSSDLTMSIEEFSMRYLQPAMRALGAQMDKDILMGLQESNFYVPKLILT